jgi:hypothetical protein
LDWGDRVIASELSGWVKFLHDSEVATIALQDAIEVRGETVLGIVVDRMEWGDCGDRGSGCVGAVAVA